MAKRTSGDGKVADLTLRILREIRDQIAALRGETATLRVDLTGRIDETNTRLGRLETRFDHFLETAGREVSDLRSRVGSLEQRINRLESR